MAHAAQIHQRGETGDLIIGGSDFAAFDDTDDSRVSAMRPKDVQQALDLDTIAKDHVWKVEPSCATTGEGIFEGLAWLSNNVKLPPK